ncbi:MAG: hypothetical protein KGL43_12805 [Burkholderiales bacterium]|nr:hypothetical protein [Burkholderiales bacterium]MDE2396942.1 hypothetical protein [Burkholderiales bacterium]MDE2454465.1 hypothetical protein [Burkholderiales bacterium]
MKTAQLPPVRVEPAVRAEIENAQREGESRSEFVEAAALQAARTRKAQQEFLARGRASIANALKTGELHPLGGVLDAMQARLDERMKKQRSTRRSPAAKAWALRST